VAENLKKEMTKKYGNQHSTAGLKRETKHGDSIAEVKSDSAFRDQGLGFRGFGRAYWEGDIILYFSGMCPLIRPLL
jgi:hypothetical protein